jgi:Rne/Rng family ribonuclease
MGKELVISAGRHETKVAILEDDQLVEVFFQRANEYSLAGSIHKGRVTRVLPGMQSAFVDIGLDRDAFLYVSDFFEDHEEYDKVASAAEDKVMKAESARRSAPQTAAPEPEPERAAAPAPAP